MRGVASMTRRVIQIVFIGILVLTAASLATAQQILEPVNRLGNFIEVGNDVFMHIIATIDFRMRTSQNYDWDSDVRDRTATRNPDDTVAHNALWDGWKFL